MVGFPENLAHQYQLIDVPSIKVSLGWTTFKNSETGEVVGLTVSNRRKEGFRRVKSHRVEIDFSKVTSTQLDNLIENKCPYVAKKAVVEESVGDDSQDSDAQLPKVSGRKKNREEKLEGE